MDRPDRSIPTDVESGAPAGGAWSALCAGAGSRWTARLAAAWLALVAALAVLAPVVASGHPVWRQALDPRGVVVSADSPLWRYLSPVDVGLLVGAAGLTVAAIAGRWARRWRAWMAGMAVGLAVLAGTLKAAPAALPDFVAYRSTAAAGTARNVYTVVASSPGQRDAALRYSPPGTRTADGRIMVLGADALGHDVLAVMLHACRLSVSVGLVSTGLAVLIGVSIGALMGYFGGWVDALLMRLVEVFMGVPVVFLLITAAAVLPRNIYLMMAIIGFCGWTGAARYTRAEFLRLREADFVHAARASGLSTPRILLRHMLPLGITPVLVESSFAVAAAILAEATLSFLALGPEGSASWGRLLADATGLTGGFLWWLAIFPGGAIFVTVLSINVLGEAIREAMDPRLARTRPAATSGIV